MWNTALCWKILLVGVKYSSLLETLLGATHHLVCEKHCTCAAWVAAAERQHKSSSTPELGIGGMLCWIKSLKKGLRKENINWKSAQDSKSSFLSSQKVLKNRIGLSSRNWKWRRGRAAHSSALCSLLNLCFQFMPKKSLPLWFDLKRYSYTYLALPLHWVVVQRATMKIGFGWMKSIGSRSSGCAVKSLQVDCIVIVSRHVDNFLRWSLNRVLHIMNIIQTWSCHPAAYDHLILNNLKQNLWLTPLSSYFSPSRKLTRYVLPLCLSIIDTQFAKIPSQSWVLIVSVNEQRWRQQGVAADIHCLSTQLSHWHCAQLTHAGVHTCTHGTQVHTTPGVRACAHDCCVHGARIGGALPSLPSRAPAPRGKHVDVNFWGQTLIEGIITVAWRRRMELGKVKRKGECEVLTEPATEGRLLWCLHRGFRVKANGIRGGQRTYTGQHCPHHVLWRHFWDIEEFSNEEKHFLPWI